MNFHTLTLASVLMLGAALGACDQIDPYQKSGAWHPLGANAANLTAMVANPKDLALGRASTDYPGDLAATAALRLRTGTTRRLPSSSISEVKTTDTASGPADTPAPATGAPAVAAAAP